MDSSLFMVCELCECILAPFLFSAPTQIKVRTLMTAAEPSVGWHHPSRQYEKGKCSCCHLRALPLAQFGPFNGIYRLLFSRRLVGGGSLSEARAFVFLILSWRMSSMKTGNLTGILMGCGHLPQLYPLIWIYIMKKLQIFNWCKTYDWQICVLCKSSGSKLYVDTIVVSGWVKWDHVERLFIKLCAMPLLIR